MIVLNLC